jgi:hypothetical protein
MAVTPISVLSEKPKFNSFSFNVPFPAPLSAPWGFALIFLLVMGWGLLANGVHNGLNWGVTLLYSCIIVFFLVV